MILENVRSLAFLQKGQSRTNCETCLRAISYELDMFCLPIEITPQLVGGAQSRARIYIICISRHRLRCKSMSDECARERLISILTRLMCGWRLTPVAVLRSDPQSGLVQRYNRHVASISRTADVTCFKWFRKHRRLARKRKMPIDSLGQFDATEISHVAMSASSLSARGTARLFRSADFLCRAQLFNSSTRAKGMNILLYPNRESHRVRLPMALFSNAQMCENPWAPRSYVFNRRFTRPSSSDIWRMLT